jgi:DNA primase
MRLYPRQFIEDLKQHADIVVLIQDYVSLKKTGATYKGLCPFHGEKTPSFHVNREKGFFHCFGCGAGGDVFKFLELHDKVSFQDAVRLLAQRFGMSLPALDESEGQRAGTEERETLLKIHEAAAAWFRQQLASGGGARVRRQVADRQLADATIDAMQLGFAPPGRDGLTRALLELGFSQALLLRAGLVVERDGGSVVDRFRNRLMIPICRDTGAVIAFGGRAVEADQQPKYLNSPETPIYSKGRTLYGLSLAKAAIRQRNFAVLVEGYFDFAQVFQAGFPAVASCGTAVTPQQAQQLRRFTGKVVLSFDPDTAGQGAAARSCEMLVDQGFDVNVAILPEDQDPDTFVRRQGGAAYGERLRSSQPYLEYLLDRAAAAENLGSAEGRARLVAAMLPVAARISDRVRRELFVEALAARARVSGDVVLRELRGVGARPATHEAAPGLLARPGAANAGTVTHVTKAEKGLIWMLVHRPAPALEALAGLEEDDLAGLSSRSVLDLARKLNEDKGFSPSVLFERLSLGEAQLVTAVASETEPHALEAEWCARSLRRLRYERERASVQQEIDRLQRQAPAGGEQLERLLVRKYDLIQRIDGLT